MRVDKFLWCIRLFKTRKLATEACRSDKVTVDRQTAKPGKIVQEGSFFTVRKEGITYEYRVHALPPSRVAASKVVEFVEDCTPKEELERKAFIQLAGKLYRQRGTGRPTKKERRDLDDFTESDDQ